MRPKDDRHGTFGDEPGRREPSQGDPVGDPVRSGRDPARDLADATRALAEEVRGAAPAELPHRLCGVAVRLLPVTGASVTLRSNGIPVRLSSTDGPAARLAEIQATLGDGPCLHAARLGAPVLAADLTAGRDALRWPVFAQEAAAAGVGAVYSIPLGEDAVCVGTLDLYRDTPGELTDHDLRTARMVADVLTVALTALPHGEDDGPGGDEPWLSGLGSDYDDVHQAIGMIMAQLGVDADEATARLRGHAFARDRTAVEVAREVLAHRTRLDPD
ncbi:MULTISPECIES: ANTAR domain-containing protein [unclassified Streptomyces]|uniref:GAF and ANTAR domain-containing protein n=1 Tax=unclassified Streptomyces TaxID=2593676 RepID=UPI0036E55E5B